VTRAIGVGSSIATNSGPQHAASTFRGEEAAAAIRRILGNHPSLSRLAIRTDLQIKKSKANPDDFS
jgi:hypothetical protein